MSIEVLYDFDSLPECDIVGYIKKETEICGTINNCPGRRMKMPRVNIDIYKGNNRTLRVFIRDIDLNIVDVTGTTAVLTVKLTKSSSTTFTKSTAVSGEGQIGSADQGELFFYIVPGDTSSLDTFQYVYGIQITLSDGKVYTVAEGTLNIMESI